MNFTYYMPVRVVAGEDCVQKNAALFAPFGTRALIVTGKSSAKNGALEDIFRVLRQNGQEFAVFDEIEANPSVATVQKGGLFARSFGADFIVAAGGGSPMDAAKAIALCARQDVADIFSHPIGEDVLPMIHIPTTAGTGSEVTQYSILTDDTAQTKRSIAAPQLFPKIAFLDGKYMEDLPQSVTVNTALDAVSHAVEGMLSVRANLFSDALARESLRLLFGEYSALRAGVYARADRQMLLYGAALAGMVIANTGTTPVHGMGYSLTYFRGVPHGRANGLLLPAFLEACKGKVPRRVSAICEALGMDLPAFSQKVDDLIGPRDVYSEAELRDYAARAAKNRNVKNCLAEFSEEELFEVLCRSVGG